MKNLKVPLLLCLLSLGLTTWWACKKDPVTPGSKIVDVQFAGRIIDENDAPVIGANIQLGTETVMTDNNGVFRTKKVRLEDKNAILKVVKNGYFDFSRAYFVEDDVLQTVTIQLLRKALVGSFNNASGATINVPGGAVLKFPANAVDASGNIRVYARYLNPTDPKLGLFMPGDLRAIATSGAEQTLATFGMLAVELEGATLTGEAQIADGKEVELTIPIANSQAAQAPAEIALWHYDTEQARWIEEGTAQKTGNTYVGKVKHFSFWNCDVGLPLVELSGTVYIGNNEHPLPGAIITLTTTASDWPGYAYTNQSGQFSGGVIRDAEMTLTVSAYNQCGTQVLHTQTVGPFNVDTELPPIIIQGPLVDVVTVSGSLKDCTGDAVSNGYVRIDQAVVFSDANGEFSHELMACTNVSSVQVQAFDLDALRESPLQTVAVPSTSNNVDLGDVTVCVSADEYIQYNLDGTQFTTLDPEGYAIDSLTGTLSIYLSSFNGSATSIYLNFEASQTGTYPLTDFSANNFNAFPIQSSNLTTDLTQFAAQPGDYFIGTFGGTFQAEQGGTHTVSGSYRVKRE